MPAQAYPWLHLAATKTSNLKGTRFASIPQIGMSGMCYVISRQSNVFLIHVTVSKIALATV